MSTCNERMIQLLAHLKMNANELAVSLGYKRTDRIYNVINGRNGISPSLARDICTLYPFNYDWIMTGEGEMLKQEVNSVVVGDDGKVRINIKPSATGRFREKRKMVERIKLLAPEFKEEGNGSISIVLKSLVEQNPTKALWVMTGNDNNVVVSRTDLEALKGQMKAFKMLYEIESKKNEELEAKIAAKAELI